MLKASALVYALVMALVIAVLSSCLVLFSWMNSVSIEVNDRKVRLLDNVNSGMNLLLCEQNIVGANETTTIDLFGKRNDSVRLTRKNWGVLEVLSVSASWKDITFSKTALAGYPCSKDPNACFYISDRDAALAVCGKTLLNGTCYLPEKGTRYAYIEGKNFVGDKPVHGTILPSEKELPRFNRELFGSISDILSGKEQVEGKLTLIDELPDSVNVSFADTTLLIETAGRTLLANRFLGGNVCIRSTGEVVIGNTARLNGILIFAREIRIEKGFWGSLQLFASDTIIIGEECRLTFPSMMGIVRSSWSPDNISLQVGKNTGIGGALFSFEEHTDNRKQSWIHLSEGDTVTGQILSNGSLNLRGLVFGMVTCNKLVLKTPSAVYENHLLDVIVDRSKLSVHYAGMNTWSLTERKKVIQWLEN